MAQLTRRGTIALFVSLFGGLDDPETYRKLRIDQAAMVVVLNDDMVATNIIFTIREVCAGVPTVANADLTDSVDILKVAGSTHVFQFTRLLGKSLARRVLGVSMTSNIIGEFGRLRIAEVPAMGTWLQDKSIAKTQLRQVTNVMISLFSTTFTACSLLAKRNGISRIPAAGL